MDDKEPIELVSTFEDFKPLLLKTKEQFKWRIYLGQIRSESLHNCPITAVRYMKDNSVYGIGAVALAAKNLLTTELRVDVINAADGLCPNSSKIKEIRQWMINNLVGETPTPP